MERGVALVTGGSRGIGAAVAKLATRAGWTVCITYRSHAGAARAVVERGDAERAVRADVAVEADVIAAFEAAAGLGPLTRSWPTRASSRPRRASTS